MFLLFSDTAWWSTQNVKMYWKPVFRWILVAGNLSRLKVINYSIVMNNRIVNRKLRHATCISELWAGVGWMLPVQSPAGTIRLESCIAASKLNIKSPWASDSATKDAECRIPQDGRQVNKGWRMIIRLIVHMWHIATAHRAARWEVVRLVAGAWVDSSSSMTSSLHCVASVTAFKPPHKHTDTR